MDLLKYPNGLIANIEYGFFDRGEMMPRGKGSNGYTAKQFIDAIPNSGGVVTTIAERVGCAWNTAKKYINEYPTVKVAWENERNRINDLARCNIIRAIEGTEDTPPDLQTSKWWLQILDPDFAPKSKIELDGQGVSVNVYMPDNGRNRD